MESFDVMWDRTGRLGLAELYQEARDQYAEIGDVDLVYLERIRQLQQFDLRLTADDCVWLWMRGIGF